MRQKASIDMTEGPILRKLFLFAVPLIINSVINQLYSTADTVMMGRFAGTLSMAAVGASGQPMNLLVNLFAGIAMGVTVNCGQLKGGRKDKELSECMHTSLVLSLLIGTVITVLGLLSCGPLLRSLDTPEDILDQAILYMKVRLSFGPIWMLATFGTNIFHAFGESRIPTVIGIISGFINVCLNVVFVPVMGMGVEGVALATGISQTINAAAVCFLLFSPKGIYRLTFSGLRLRWKHTVNILSVGIPNGLSNIVFSVSNVFLQASVNRFGSMVVAGNTAASELVSYVILLLAAMRSGCISATAQCCGARKLSRVRRIAKVALPACVVLTILLNIPITIFGKSLMTLIADDATVAELGFPRLMFNCWGYMLFALVKVFGGGLAGMRKSSVSLLCDLCGIIAPRLLWVWFVVPHLQTPVMLYAIYPVSWGIAAVLTGIAFYYHLRKLEQAQPLAAPAP